MAAAFRRRPDSISWENQGVNVAAADLDRDGTPELKMRLEICGPPYMFKFDKARPRPKIEGTPADVSYSGTITLRTARAEEVKWVSPISPGLTMHSFNGTQRLVDLGFRAAAADRLEATLPDDRNVAPPGWYMLFLTDRRGVPSVASWTGLARRRVAAAGVVTGSRPVRQARRAGSVSEARMPSVATGSGER